MKRSEEIFNILSKGGFIVSNSIKPQNNQLYDLIEEDEQEYADYIAGIGFQLDKGDGYYYFSRREAKVDLQRKLEAMCKWIDYLDFLTTFNSTFGSGFEFHVEDFLIQINSDLELKEKAKKLFLGKKTNQEIVEKLIKEMETMGVVELIDETERAYKVTAAFHYLEELIDCLTISEEIEDEIPQ